MPPRLPVTLKLTFLTLPPLLYSFYVYQRLRPTSHLSIHVSNTIPASLAISHTVTGLINPMAHVAGTDTRRLVLPVSQIPRDGSSGHSLSDREILVRLVSGVWAGRVFAPERWALGMAKWVGGRSFLGIRGAEEGKGLELWKKAEIRAVREWEVGRRVAGAFQVVDHGVTERLQGDGGAYARGIERETYVDFVFGSDTGFLRGVHRFSVLRRPLMDGNGKAKESGQDELELRFAALACDPIRNKPLKPAWLAKFHLAYAMLLFRDGVAEVLASDR